VKTDLSVAGCLADQLCLSDVQIGRGYDIITSLKYKKKMLDKSTLGDGPPSVRYFLSLLYCCTAVIILSCSAPKVFEFVKLFEDSTV
jgi:hypothetical protein